MDAIQTLARFAHETTFDQLPPALVRHEKDLSLDTFGVGIAGAAAPGCSVLLAWARENGGCPQSTVFIYGDKLPAINAGMVNSTFFQALDFDETHDTAILHTHCSCLSAALAASEWNGGCSGKEFLTAVALGAEVMGRIGRCVHSRPTFARTGALAGFAAAITAGKLLGLTLEQLEHALGIVLPQASGTLQSNIDGALVKRMHPAFGVRAALFACDMARRGITGAKGVLEGKFGYMNLFENGDYDRENMLHGLGKDWDALHLGFKAHPCSRDSAGALEAGIELFKRGIRADDVVRAEVTMPLSPFEVSGKPYADISGNRVVECILNGAWAASVGLAHGKSDLDDFSEPGVNNPELDALAKKIDVSVDSEVKPNSMTPVTMTVHLKDGRTERAVCKALLGSVENPMSQEKLEEKFRMCAAHAPISPRTGAIEQLMDCVRNLDSLSSSLELSRAMVLV